MALLTHCHFTTEVLQDFFNILQLKMVDIDSKIQELAVESLGELFLSGNVSSCQ